MATVSQAAAGHEHSSLQPWRHFQFQPPPPPVVMLTNPKPNFDHGRDTLVFPAVVEPVTQQTLDTVKVSTILVPQVATLAAARHYDSRGISSDSKGSRQHL